MRSVFPLLAPLLLALLASGCVVALRVGSPPTQVKLKLETREPQQCSVRVAVEPPANYPVASDGRVEFTVPTFHGGCDWYLFGFIKTRDGSAESRRVIELWRGERTLRKLSLNQIEKLPRDDAGFSVVKARE